MLGAIIGDIVGSKYEFNNIKTKEFTFFQPDMFFTDDTVMTVAIYDALSSCKGNYSYLSDLAIEKMQEYGKKRYPMSDKIGYGSMFNGWLTFKIPAPYNSYGNGSAMRVSSVAYFAKSLEEVKKMSYAVTSVTHNHEEGIKGAEATAVATFMALHGASKKEIKDKIESDYYSLDFDYQKLKETYSYKVSCQRTVPEALYCFLISNSFEDTIRTGVSIGGDSDTLCAIAGSVAEAYFGIPREIKSTAKLYLDKFLNKKVDEFDKMFSLKDKDRGTDGRV